MRAASYGRVCAWPKPGLTACFDQSDEELTPTSFAVRFNWRKWPFSDGFANGRRLIVVRQAKADSGLPE